MGGGQKDKIPMPLPPQQFPSSYLQGDVGSLLMGGPLPKDANLRAALLGQASSLIISFFDETFKFREKSVKQRDADEHFHLNTEKTGIVSSTLFG